MKIIKLNTNNQRAVIKETVNTLKSGGLVVFPSDTVYGLLADSHNPQAIAKLLTFKDRPVGKAISVFVANQEMAEKYVKINQNAANVFKNLLPGPFTVVCKAKFETRNPKYETNSNVQNYNFQNVSNFDIRYSDLNKNKIDPRLLAENGTLGIRIPDYPLINQLLAAYGKPLTATSANIGGNPPCHSVTSLLKTLSDKKKYLIALIIDAGKLPNNKPSTVIDTTSGQLVTLRTGDLLPKTSNSLISKSENETKKLARFLVAKFIRVALSKPLVFLLEGDLGAGKTIFAKGIGTALKIKEEITSPTFPICNEFPLNSAKIMNASDIKRQGQSIKKNCGNTSPTFFHYDLYRLESAEELTEIDFLASFTCGNVYAIEWPNRIPESIFSALKKTAEIIYLQIKKVDFNTREISWGKD